MLILVPCAHVIAAVDLGNIAAIDLPPQVGEVVLMRDNDPDHDERAPAPRSGPMPLDTEPAAL